MNKSRFENITMKEVLVDYRDKKNVTIIGDKDVWIVKLKLFLNNGNRDMLIKWLKRWTPEQAVEDFQYLDYAQVIDKSAKWVSEDTITFKVKMDVKIRELYEELMFNSLEDGSYEGDPENTFWIVSPTWMKENGY